MAICPAINWVQYSPSAIDATSLIGFFDTTPRDESRALNLTKQVINW
jgi:hypothetical protein